MIAILGQLLDKLRQDDHNPLHALDRWLLRRVDEQPPSSIWELSVSCRMRQSPRCRGPELVPGDVRRWALEAERERALIKARAVDPERPNVLDWSLTDAGRWRLDALIGARERVAGVLAAVASAPDAWTHAVERLRAQDDVATGEPPPRRTGLPPIVRSRGDAEAMTDGQAVENLCQIEHIVVLMMENRSFDHMLGYLDLLDGQTEI